MKAFVTGSTGFIGARLVQKLLRDGWEVNALVRSQQGANMLHAIGAQPIWGDITARESMRAGMRGCDVVFHLAAWYKIGGKDWEKAEAINIQGTRNVLELAIELKIPKIIYTSTIAVYGDTHNALADESFVRSDERFLTEYDRTKWAAHFQVAQPLIDQGAPIVILMPGAVYGTGDPSLIGEMMRYFYHGWLPVLPDAGLTLTFAHVDDIVQGHLLAAEKGVVGQSYILAGPKAGLRELVQLWANLIGKRAPFFIPIRFVKFFTPLVQMLEKRFQLPALISTDAIAILDATYIAISDKAHSQLGWQTRPLEEGMRDVFTRMTGNPPPAPFHSKNGLNAEQRRKFVSASIVVSLGLLVLWLLTRQRNKK
jgi:nucleoside-diphosphate-sugar epimerase